KVTDISTLGPASVDATKPLLQRWHAERNPSHEEVVALRKICPGRGVAAAGRRYRLPPAQGSDAVRPCRGDRLDRAGRPADGGQAIAPILSRRRCLTGGRR